MCVFLQRLLTVDLCSRALTLEILLDLFHFNFSFFFFFVVVLWLLLFSPEGEKEMNCLRSNKMYSDRNYETEKPLSPHERWRMIIIIKYKVMIHNSETGMLNRGRGIESDSISDSTFTAT